MDKYLPCTIQMKSQRTDSWWKLGTPRQCPDQPQPAAGEGGAGPSCVHTGTMTRDTGPGPIHDSALLWWTESYGRQTRVSVELISLHFFKQLSLMLKTKGWHNWQAHSSGTEACKSCVKWKYVECWAAQPSSDWMLLSHLLKVFKSEINGCVLFKFYVNCTKFKFPNEAECVMSKLPIVAPAHGAT